MYPEGDYDKKSLNMLILEILQKYTDADHRLKQEEIIRLLQKHYNVKCDRRSIQSNIESLQNLGYRIAKKSGYWLQHRNLDMDSTELRQVIDSVLCSTELSREFVVHLLPKLIELGNLYFKPEVECIYNLPEEPSIDKKRIRENLDVLNDAIKNHNQVGFTYNEYGTDFRLHPVEEALVVNPFQIIAANGRYYLLGNEDSGGDAKYYRVDQISKIALLDVKVKDQIDVPAISKGFRMPKHRAEHFCMDIGDQVEVVLRTRAEMMGALIDSFGKDFPIEKEDGGTILVKVSCAEEALYRWAMLYGGEVEILEPENLREQVRKTVAQMMETYRE